jgi:hypothetical protein
MEMVMYRMGFSMIFDDYEGLMVTHEATTNLPFEK